MNQQIQAPAPLGLLGEVRGLFELPSLLLNSPSLAQQTRGRGEPVMVLPGFGAGDASTAVLRAYLRYLGHRPHGWASGATPATSRCCSRTCSRSDAVVAWRACIDRDATNVDHVEVGATHLGLGFSPKVFEIIAKRLARH